MKTCRDRLSTASFFLRLGSFLGMLALLWLPLAGLIYNMISDANTVNILVMSLLFVEFTILLHFWGRSVYQESRLFHRYGLSDSRQNRLELLHGLSLGFISLFGLFWIQGVLGLLVWQAPSTQLVRLILEGLLVGVGVGFAEELVFRGWLLDELQRNYSPTIALWANSLAFACLHFGKPLAEILRSLPQFWGLLLLGLSLVWAKRSCQGRLGLPIGLHAGLVWGFYIVNVGELVKYAQQAPAWVTGINQNPLAGSIGLAFLAAIALYMKRRSHNP